MAATSTALNLGRSPERTFSLYLKEMKYEFLKNLRIPRYSASVIIFPLMFYVLFGLLMGRQNIGNVSTTTYLLASYGTFGVLGAALFGTAAGLASERGLGWLQVKRASPMPPFAYFVAKFFMGAMFSFIVVALLLVLGFAFGGVRMSMSSVMQLVGTLVAGSIPFSAMGLAVGYFMGPNSAPAVLNLIYLPMSFTSGLWIPIRFLPKVFQHIALYMPPYHLAQLALQIIGMQGTETVWTHWKVLIGFTLLCLGIARYGFQKDEEKMYG